MAEYMLLCRDEEFDATQMAPGEFEALLGQFMTWTAGLQEQGVLKGQTRLSSGGGTTVRQRDGGLVVDGPYAEAKEAVVGIFHIEAESYAEAERIAGQIPTVALGQSVEVRELHALPGQE